MTLTLVLVIVSFLAAQQLPQAPPRDLPAPADALRGTAIVRGRVLDRDSGTPLPRAIVVLVRMSAPNGPDRRFARSGEDGGFEFRDVLAGSYYLGADTGEERPTHLMQMAGTAGPSRGLRPLIPTRTIDIKTGEVRNGLDIHLSRALVISGVVVNAHGEPLANMDVRAELVRSGRVIRRAPVRRTDDRGEFRVFGLPPGRYRVCALAPPSYVRPPVLQERLISTCYPSATREQDAGLVILGSGAEPQVQIRMQQSGLFRLTGVVLDSSGAPAPGASIRVSTRNRLDVYGMTFGTDAAGRFAVGDLISGEYDLEASAPGPKQAAGHRGELAFQTVYLDADLDVLLSMSRTARVAGQIVFDEGAIPPPEARAQMSVSAIGMPRLPRSRAAHARADLTFELDELHGPQVLAVDGAPDGWVVGSIRYAGVDVTDAPFELRDSGDARQLQIAMTRRGALVTGRVVDAAGAPLPGAHVFLISAQPQRWARGRSGPTALADDGGAFSLPMQRPGEYLLVALTQEDAPDWPEREDHELLAKMAERVTLAEGSNPPITLRVALLPEER
jgi:protocatechuate 3,4-dioxygenase beta subunit